MKKGDVLEKRYEIRAKIGAGGTSVVYLVYDRSTKKYWALKSLYKADADEAKIEAYETETNFLSQVEDPAIPVMIDAFQTEEAYCHVIEYVRGETLEEILKKTVQLRQDFTYEIMLNLARALSYMHGHSPQFVYCDLKPENIMVLSNRSVKLIDFGSVVSTAGQKKYRTGTPGYAAPELAMEHGKCDARSDVYSFGVLFYELVMGERFQGDYVQNPFVKPFVRELIFRCTRMNQNNRYEDMQEVYRILKENLNRKGFLCQSKKVGNPFLIQDLERTILVEENRIGEM